MFSPDVYSWRSDPEKGGPSSALVDIGSHWCDLAQYIGDSNISAVCADLATAVPQRLRPDTAQESFATTRMKGTLVEVSAEDTGSVMLRFANGARGSFQVGQVHAGHKNDLWIEINGRTLSLRWRQEQQNELWIGRHDQPSQVLVKEPAALQPDVRRFSPLPAGHQEGWADSLLNVLREGYGWMRAGVHTPKPAAVASFEDGSQIHAVLDAILRSYSRGGTWQSVAEEVSDEPQKERLDPS
jgi:predicted dehydrogenase